jgi:hypothetical protein
LNIINYHIVPGEAEKKRLSDYLIGIFNQLPSRKSVKKAIKRESCYWMEKPVIPATG